MNQKIVDVTEATFSSEIEQAGLPVLIDFWAPWCGPCKMIQPILEELARMYRGCVKFTKVNADENKALVEKYGVRGLPTLLLLKNGEIVERAVGLNPQQGKSRFVELLDRHVEGRYLSPAGAWRAFAGDTAVKRRVIDQVRGHIDAAQIHGVETYSVEWPLCDTEADRYSLFGAALHGTAIEAYESRFGIPASAALLEDAVHNLLVQTSDDEGRTVNILAASDRGLPVEWFERIPPGADLSRMTPNFLHRFLLRLADEPLPYGAVATEDARAALRDVARLHVCLATGDAPSLADWRAVREAAAQASPGFQDDPVSWGLATCAAKFAWAPEDLGLSTRDGINAVFSGLSMAAIRSMYSDDAWAERDALIKAASAIETGGDSDSGLPDEARAVRARRREIGLRDMARQAKLKLELGRQWHSLLMQSLDATLTEGAL